MLIELTEYVYWEGEPQRLLLRADAITAVRSAKDRDDNGKVRASVIVGSNTFGVGETVSEIADKLRAARNAA